MGSTSDYAARSGATAEVAEETGQVLHANEKDVEACDVRQIKALSGYSAIVLGSPACTGELMQDAAICQAPRAHPARAADICALI